MRYFKHSLLFAFGIGFILVGLTFIIYFQLHHGSDPSLIEATFSLIGLGVPLAVQGISGMLGYIRYSKITGASGFLLCLLAILIYVFLYPENWFYPNVSLVATMYAFGLVLVFGGLFAEVVQRIVEGKRTTVTEVFKEEKEDVTFIEPAKFEPEIEIKDFDLDVKFGAGRIGKVIKVKDNVDYDASMLNRVKEGKLEIKMKDDKITEISKILRSMKERMGKD